MTQRLIHNRAIERKDDAPNTERAAFGLRELKFSGGDRTFTGYGAVFGNVDAHGDVIAPGAFKRTLQEHAAAGTMPAMLAQHGDWSGAGTGMMPIGVWTAMQEDSKGLRVEGRLSDTPRGNEAYALLKDGALKGLSIGYKARDFTRGAKDGEPRRTLKGVDLHEVSLVTFPSNRLARVEGVKGERKTARDCEQALRDAGFPRSLAKTIAHLAKSAFADQRDADGDAEELVNAVKASTASLSKFIERI